MELRLEKAETLWESSYQSLTKRLQAIRENNEKQQDASHIVTTKLDKLEISIKQVSTQAHRTYEDLNDLTQFNHKVVSNTKDRLDKLINLTTQLTVGLGRIENEQQKIKDNSRNTDKILRNIQSSIESLQRNIDGQKYDLTTIKQDTKELKKDKSSILQILDERKKIDSSISKLQTQIERFIDRANKDTQSLIKNEKQAQIQSQRQLLSALSKLNRKTQDIERSITSLSGQYKISFEMQMDQMVEQLRQRLTQVINEPMKPKQTKQQQQKSALRDTMEKLQELKIKVFNFERPKNEENLVNNDDPQ